MQYSTAKIERELNAGGMEYEQGSVYDRLGKLTDLRGANGKRYELEGVLMIVVLAKLCGEDKPIRIAEWAEHRKEELLMRLCLNWRRMPPHNTYRRILAYKVYEQEVERLVGEYNQHGEQGEVYAMDGKARRGMRQKDEEGHEYCLSVYDVEQAKVLSQVEVGRKKNEITKASQALKSVEISQKVVTGDALHTQRGLASKFWMPKAIMFCR
ncbi:MAG: ISAs1 family transposase [Anaerolineales bacterium]|nr:ISAs1 family transposase [Anaerolineales bacterium]